MLLSLHHPLALALTVALTTTTRTLAMALLRIGMLLLMLLMLLLGSVRGGGRVQGVLVFHYVTISRHLFFSRSVWPAGIVFRSYPNTRLVQTRRPNSVSNHHLIYGN